MGMSTGSDRNELIRRVPPVRLYRDHRIPLLQRSPDDTKGGGYFA